MTKKTPTQLSTEHLEAEGYRVELAEHHARHSVTTHDLFGFVDLVAIRGPLTLAVQTTTESNAPSRVTKVKASPWLDTLRNAGWRVVVHGWRPDGRLREIVLAEGGFEQLRLFEEAGS